MKLASREDNDWTLEFVALREKGMVVSVTDYARQAVSMVFGEITVLRGVNSFRSV
jgi:hypothetical protein